MMNQLVCLKKICSLSALLLAAVVMVGCEKAPPPLAEVVTDTTAEVSGTVTVNGSPVSSGQIVLFSLSNGNSHTANLQSEGKFELEEKIPAVEYTVFFLGSDGGGHPSVPEEYQSETSSSYTTTVTAGPNNLEIAL